MPVDMGSDLGFAGHRGTGRRRGVSATARFGVALKHAARTRTQSPNEARFRRGPVPATVSAQDGHLVKPTIPTGKTGVTKHVRLSDGTAVPVAGGLGIARNSPGYGNRRGYESTYRQRETYHPGQKDHATPAGRSGLHRRAKKIKRTKISASHIPITG